MCDLLLERECNYYALWYIACADYLIRTLTRDVHVTFPLIPDRFGDTPQKRSNIKFVPVLVTSHFIFWTYQNVKKNDVGE